MRFPLRDAPPSYRKRRGAISVLAAFCMIIMVAMVAFAVDVGYVVHVDTELQRTVDACAMAAVQELPDRERALSVAQAVAAENRGSEGPALDLSDIEFGTWDRDTATFTVTNVSPNAARVTLRRTAEAGNPLRLFFGSVMGVTHSDVSASAVAMYHAALCGPLVGIDSIEMHGTPETDSFRSSVGSYAAQTPGENGDICSDGSINVVGAARVNGDANPGKDHQTNVVGAAEVTGNTDPRTRPLNLPSVDTSDVANSNNNDDLPMFQRGPLFLSPLDANRNFSLTGNVSYDIPPGDYYFNDLTLTGQSSLNVSGRTRIYLTGDLSTAGGRLANSTGIADNLQVLMTGGDATITGNADMYAVIYGPNSDIRIQGTGQLYGAVVGRTLAMRGTGDAHYDEDLDLSDTLNLPKQIALVK